jgi:hypothetical protein
MSDVVASQCLNAKFVRGERWDVLGRLVQILEHKAGFPLAGKVADALKKAGMADDPSPPAGRHPRARMAPTVGGGASHLRFSVLADGTVLAEPLFVRGGNDLWRDEPDGEGVWWAVNPDPQFADTFLVAEVRHEAGAMTPRLVIRMPGEAREYPLDHFRGQLLWQRAVRPIYRWPAPDHG